MPARSMAQKELRFRKAKAGFPGEYWTFITGGSKKRHHLINRGKHMMNSVQPRPASLAVRGAPPTGLDPNSAAAASFWDISHTYQAAFQVLLAGPDRTMMDALRHYLQAHEFRPRLAFTTQEISKCL